MLISIGIWAGQGGALDHIGPATMALLHWVSALIAMPAIAYAGRPFFASALAALRQRRTNMDVPISLGVLLVTGMSLVETINGGAHTYFDSAVTLLFFLLVGRVLDHRARGQARATAEQLLALRATDVAVVQPDGTIRRCGQEQVSRGRPGPGRDRRAHRRRRRAGTRQRGAGHQPGDRRKPAGATPNPAPRSMPAR